MSLVSNTLKNLADTATKAAKKTTSSTSKSTASKVASAATSAVKNSTNGSDAYKADDGKWYLRSTGEPLGTGGTNADWANAEKYQSRGMSSDYGTYEDDLTKLTNAQRKAQVSQLKAARAKALANLDVQEQNIKPLYENARNQTSAASQQGARSFAEYLANRGLTNSGAAAQGEINRQSALNNNLGNLNVAEANAYRDIANQRTAIENDYAANLANANNQITTDYYNNLLNYNQAQRQNVQNLQAQALGQYAGDYQAQINNLLAQGYSPNSMEVLQLQALRGQKANTLYNSGLNNALANIQAGNIDYNNAAALGMTVEQARQYYNNYQAQLQAQAKAEQEALERQIAQQNLENEIALQKLANDTAQTQYNINKPYYKYSSGGGSGGNNENTGEYIKRSDVNSLLKEMSESGKVNYLDSAYANGTISDSDYKYFYNLYQLPV